MAHHGAFSLMGGAIDGDAFAKGVAVAYHHLRRGTAILEVLGLHADAGSRKHPVLLTQPNVAIDHHMGTDLAIVANLDLWSNHRIGPNRDALP